MRYYIKYKNLKSSIKKLARCSMARGLDVPPRALHREQAPLPITLHIYEVSPIEAREPGFSE